ncbi:uncharacterized protein LOC127120995 [Lathyrus oleraceus]|uniref:uncharacterized protein LOC127120995 n=1 Tax=Pisum sativum TaxID=3888 RepID=UPI0021D06B53|nr:uncharacterized protein LOC127120995 [Pisum sativum]
MQSLFGFHETLKVVTNGVPAVGEDSTDAQRNAHKDAKKKDCKAPFYIQLQKDKGSTKVKDEGANLARQDLDDSDDLEDMVVVADDHVESKIWFLDSGCSNHTTGRKVWLVDFDESKKSKVKLADNSSLQAKSEKKIKVLQTDGGGEYTSNRSEALCSEHGVDNEVPYQEPEEQGS